MGKKKRRIFPKKKRSVFSRPHPIRRKMIIKHRKMKAFFHKHNPKIIIQRGIRRLVININCTYAGMRRMVGGIYTVSDKVRDKIAESTMALDNPFSAHFYEDRCIIQ